MVTAECYGGPWDGKTMHIVDGKLYAPQDRPIEKIVDWEGVEALTFAEMPKYLGQYRLEGPRFVWYPSRRT